MTSPARRPPLVRKLERPDAPTRTTSTIRPAVRLPREPGPELDVDMLLEEAMEEMRGSTEESRHETITLPTARGRADTRQYERLPFEVKLDLASEHNFYAGLMLNISEGGLFVATHVHHAVGTQIELRLLLPGDETPSTVLAEVRWVRPHVNGSESSPGLGLRFVELPPHVAARIDAFLKQREPLYYEDA